MNSNKYFRPENARYGVIAIFVLGITSVYVPYDFKVFVLGLIIIINLLFTTHKK